MSEVFYRKYRPKNFGEAINQKAIKTILKNALKTGRISHAYLFAGPRGVGKTSFARILAKAVNCEKLKAGEPDTTCDICRAIQKNIFFDLVEIDAASYTGVDNIREVIKHVKFAPSKAKYKVFIIDEVHMLSKAAFNALLKTLEEPPEHAIFILATTEIHKVPATIISRTQRFDFKAVSVKDVQTLLERVVKKEKVNVEASALRLIAQTASGSFRDGLSILDQVISFSADKIDLGIVEEILGVNRTETYQKFLNLIISGKKTETVEFIRKLAFEGKDMVQFTHGFLEYLRLVLLYKMGIREEDALGLLSDEAKAIKQQAGQLSGKRLLLIIRNIMQAYRESRHMPVQELPLLTAIMDLTVDDDDGGLASSKTALTKVKSKPVEERKAMQSETDELGLGTVVDRWSEVLSRVKEYNHSLISSLRLGRLVKMEGRQLLLAFPYNFHKETISARKNKVVLEQVLEDVFGERLKVQPLLEREVSDRSAQTDSEQDDSDLLNEAIKVLGKEK